MTLTDRCENWAACYRMRMRYGHAMSIEGAFRSPQGEHWLFGSAPPPSRASLDPRDACEVNGAWQAMPDAFHQFLLASHYVRRWSPDKCVREARQFDGMLHTRAMVTDMVFAAYLGMAHSLLSEQLSLPATFRRQSLAGRVRRALDLDPWLAADAVLTAA